MNEATCDDVRMIAPELALGIASGEERARALTHAAGCTACSELLADMARVADAMLLAAPEHEPPPGFEARVLGRFPRRSRPWRRVATLAAALMVVGAIAASGTWAATAGARRTAGHYEEVLAVAGGTYFGAATLRASSGQDAGTVFVYTGETSWLFCVLEDAEAQRRYRVVALRHDAEPVGLGVATITGTRGSWGGILGFDPRTLTGIRLLEPDGTPAFEATFAD